MTDQQPLVSIIIPTFNRAHLIGETLDSIIAQTYQNWECIVVDDGSTDDTKKVMQTYCQKDNRIKYFHRPEEHLPGGNGARNYGFKMSRGEYIQWFDSDDLMVSRKIELKVKALQENDVDFVVSKTKYFNYENKHIDSLYDNLSSNLLPENYCAQKVNWLTPDALIIKNKYLIETRFNEYLKSGQEYNFFCRYVQFKPEMVFLNNVLTRRRHHDDCTTNNLLKNNIKTKEERFEKFWVTYLDLKNMGTEKSKKAVLYKCISLYYKREYIKLPKKFYTEIFYLYGYKVFWLLPLSILRHINRGYFIYLKFKPSSK